LPSGMSSLLLLTEDDVQALLRPAEAVDAVERAFYDFANGTAVMPPKLYLEFDQHAGDLRVMPASLGSGYAGVKIVNSHERNPARGLPAVVGTYLLYSQETGMPLSIMGATFLTAMRTGAASAVACKYLARRDSRSLGLVGAGVQAGFQTRAISQVLSLETVRAWAPDNDRPRRDALLGKLQQEFPELEFMPAQSLEEAAAADVVCTTTPSRAPLVRAGAVLPGTHINAVGADGPGKQELDPVILKDARIVVDEWHQALAGGEVNVPVGEGIIGEGDIAGTLSDLVSGAIEGRMSSDEITIFDSTGLAIQDIAVATLVYERALSEGRGTKIHV
jgi:alanine dehydrogenase